MEKNSLAIAVLAVVLSGCAAVASDGKGSGGAKPHGKGMMMGMMSKMDANNDGQISKDEFMKSHEMMFDHMKNKDGVIEVKKMENCCSGTMGGMGGGMTGGMMGEGKMRGHGMMENCPMMDGQMGKSNK